MTKETINKEYYLSHRFDTCLQQKTSKNRGEELE